MKKKILRVVVISILLAALLWPEIRYIKDGGSVEYHAALYQVIHWHAYMGLDEKTLSEQVYYDGLEIKILGVTVYNNAQEMSYRYCK